MRLIEVVVLMGAHCVSPVQHTPSMTEAGKVQCAIVVERDSQTGAVKVTPDSAAGDERVLAAVQKLIADAEVTGIGTTPTIVPVAAPRGGQAAPVVPVPASEITPATPIVVDKAAPGEPDKQPDTPRAEPQDALQCKGGAVPEWYTKSPGHRKYRCVK